MGKSKRENPTRVAAAGRSLTFSRVQLWVQKLAQWLTPTRAALTAAIVAIVVYLSALPGDFVYDDLVLHNHKVVTGEYPASDAFRLDFWGNPIEEQRSHKSYRPITVLLLRFAYMMGNGFNPLAFHIFPIILHAIASFLIFCVTSKLIKNRWAVLASTIIFAVHPVHVESVANIMGQADVLSAIFMLTALWLFMNGTPKSSHPQAITTPVFTWSLSGVALATLLATFSKEQGVTILPVLAAYDLLVASLPLTLRLQSREEKHCPIWRRITLREGWWRPVARTGLLLLIGIAIMAVRFQAMGGNVPSFSPHQNMVSYNPSRLVRVMTYHHFWVLHYLWLIWPKTFCHDWSMTSIEDVKSLTDIRNLATMMFYGLVLSLVAWWLRLTYAHLTAAVQAPRRPAKGAKVEQEESEVASNDAGTRNGLALGLALLLLPYLPASNALFYVGFTLAERIMYIPSLGFTIFCAALFEEVYFRVSRLPDQQKQKRLKAAGMVIATVVVCLLTWKAQLRIHDWQSAVNLNTHDLESNPRNAKIWYNNAVYFSENPFPGTEKDPAKNPELNHLLELFDAVLLYPADHALAKGHIDTSGLRNPIPATSIAAQMAYTPPAWTKYTSHPELPLPNGNYTTTRNLTSLEYAIRAWSLHQEYTDAAIHLSTVFDKLEMRHLQRLCYQWVVEVGRRMRESGLIAFDFGKNRTIGVAGTLLAESYYRSDQYDEALEAIKNALTFLIDDPPSLITLARVLPKNAPRGAEETIKALCEPAIELDPQNPELLVNYLQFYTRHQLWVEADRILHRFLEDERLHSAQLAFSAVEVRLHITQLQWNEMVGIAQSKAMQVPSAPTPPPLYMVRNLATSLGVNLSQLYLLKSFEELHEMRIRLSEPKHCLQFFKEYVEFMKKHAADDPLAALPAYRSALDQYPDQVDLLVGMGKLLVDEGARASNSSMLKEAEDYLLKATAIAPEKYLPFAFLGSLYAFQGNYTKSESIIRTGVQTCKSDEDCSMLLNMLGDLHYQLGNLSLSLAWYSESVARHPPQAEVEGRIHELRAKVPPEARMESPLCQGRTCQQRTQQAEVSASGSVSNRQSSVPLRTINLPEYSHIPFPKGFTRANDDLVRQGQ